MVEYKPENSSFMEEEQAQKPSFIAGIVGFLWETAKIVIISLVIIIPIRYFIIQPFFVRGESMAPTFSDGEYLIIDEISYRLTDPQRGDVIVFRFPEDPSQFYIKRIIGLPGESIDIKNGKVLISNQDNPIEFSLDESYIAVETLGDLNIKLDDNEYFVMGDNRGASSDSRRWGPLDENLIIGKVWLRAWPVSRAQAIETPSY